MGSNDQRSTIRKVAVSSFLGNFIEWFDYATYSYFAVVIANVFFPGDDPALALMQTFAVFALSFLLRPIGAIFWGSMGDKKGRKWALSTSIFLMTGATFCIGLLPGYLAIGLAAPILLLLLRSWLSTLPRTSAACTARSCLLRRPWACWWALRSPRSCTRSCLTQP